MDLDYKVVFNAFADAVIAAENPGKILYVNPTVERLLGWSPAETIGQPLTMMISSQHQAGFQRQLIDGASSRIGRAFRVGALHKDKSEIEVELSLTEVPVEHGALMVAVFRDLRDRLELEADARLYQQAQEAVRARDEFLSVASHELKTPLCALSLSLQTLALRVHSTAAKAPSLEELGTKAKFATSVVQRILRLMDEMLDVSRITAGRMMLDLQELELSALLEEVLERTSDQLQQAGCTLHFETEGRLSGKWDRLRIEQIVTNLLSNAMKYGRGKPIEVTLSGDLREACLTVRDWGIGIPVEEQVRIFERFERAVTARSYTGFGLGLWIVRQIVEALGGSIHVQSQPGRGSLFMVRIPRDPISAAQLPFQSPNRTGT